MREKITEGMKDKNGRPNIFEEWYKQARHEDMSAEKLPEFIRHLTEDYEHDYGTICHACAAAAVAGVQAVNHSDQGGITGFQAGAIMWEFIRHWNREHNKTGLKLVDYDNMLYPQYEYHFEKTISKSTWKNLQKTAKENLADPNLRGSKDVRNHWQSIVDGVVPFGYVVEEED